MALTEQEVFRIIYPDSTGVRGRRFTQDTPILPDVWVLFGTQPDRDHEVLLSPHRNCSISDLVQALRKRLKIEAPNRKLRLAYNESHVLAEVDYRLLIRAVLPLSDWWRREITWNPIAASLLEGLLRDPNFEALLLEPARQEKASFFTENILNLIRIVGGIGIGEPLPSDAGARSEYLRRVVRKVGELIGGLDFQDLSGRQEKGKPTAEGPAPLWSVFSNREATSAVVRSRLAVKGDAALLLFGITCKSLRWAVIDSGIDARHQAFRKAGANGKFGPDTTRVTKTYDFTRLKSLIQNDFTVPEGQPSAFDKLDPEERRTISRDLKRRLQTGQPLDWQLIAKYLDIPHDGSYRPPVNEHGTHVAGILAANCQPAKDCPDTVVGMCPDIELYDLRVIDDNGTGDEFCILAALQFVRFLNSNKDRTVLHGVNLSLSLPHKVKSFACGSTPICEECNRLVANGIVVVAAAGNSGYGGDGIAAAGDYRDISITDPGNAEDVITVGATHRYMPHKYGVSYFSSRGPTGDGRMKPDLVAPGEQITSTIPNDNFVTLDGTSMAAPHVSGAAALLMARHSELMGSPRRIKEILCGTATDLGRERSFQGAGMLDVLRALQSV